MQVPLLSKILYMARTGNILKRLLYRQSEFRHGSKIMHQEKLTWN